MSYHEVLEQISNRLLNPNDLVKIIVSGANSTNWKKITIRPVLLRNRLNFQFSFFDEKKDITKNFDFIGADHEVRKLNNANFSQVQIVSRNSTITFSLSGKGYKSKESEHAAPLDPDLSHDRNKNYPINLENSLLMLQTIGIATKDERIKADMQSKFHQINEFIKLVSQSVADNLKEKKELVIIDCGCGNAYLTFALYHYFSGILNLKTTLIGLDVRGDLLKSHRRHARELGWEGMEFVETKIIEYIPKVQPDIVLSLHACDTATDEAVAKGIKWGADMIYAVPCCHHHVQTQIEKNHYDNPMAAVLREEILKERLGDILTDTFRVLLLRMALYQADVVQFVLPEFTAKNLLIRAVKKPAHSPINATREFDELKKLWRVEPYLEKLLKEKN